MDKPKEVVKMEEKVKSFREIFFEEGFEEGIAEGFEEGKRKGVRKGIRQGIRQGMVKGCIKAFQSMDLPVEDILTKIMEICHLNRRQAFDALEKFSPIGNNCEA